jgi:phosphoribosylaminoimidazolecarboxamide formyltransferase/IMP cyclohydrolase
MTELWTPMIRVRRALLSVFDKSGVLEFARGLADLSVELLSTGGTARTLREGGLAVTDVAEVTGFPEMLDGRVKTLHPRIHGGLLAARGNPEHEGQLAAQGITPIDLVAINLYPFEATVGRRDGTVAEAIEQIDIGGPALLRSAAKNFPGVAVIADPADYPAVLAELRQKSGALSSATCLHLARKAFVHTARYDALIAELFDRLTTEEGRIHPDTPLSALGAPPAFPALLHLRLEKLQDLRYGENPHQRAAFYRELGRTDGLAGARQLQGKELSYNNLLDLHAGWELIREFEGPAAAIIKHGNPCGAAIAGRLADAYSRAYAADSTSAFGGIIAVNRPVDEETARGIAATFMEAVAAPGYGDEALTVLREKKSLRLLELPAGDGGWKTGDATREVRHVSGGMLVQEPDAATLDPAALRIVTRRPPSEAERRALHFAWTIVKHVRSNAIVLATDQATVGIGAGQMSRVDAVKLAITKAGALSQGTVLASDAFFPFRDGVDVAAAAGVTAIIQPGGSLRDAEVIAAADDHGLAMLLTGIRHFRH